MLFIKDIKALTEDVEYMKNIKNFCNLLPQNKETRVSPGGGNFSQASYTNINKETQKTLAVILRKVHNWVKKEYYKNKEIKLIDCKILKHYKHKKHESLYQFAWHVDNHPESVINFIIYLNDVKDLEGGMELLFSREDNMPVYRKFSGQPGGIQMDNEIRELISKEKYYSVPLLGKQGTTILFNNNVIHRAGSSLTKDRTVILLQFDFKDSNFANCHKSLIQDY